MLRTHCLIANRRNEAKLNLLAWNFAIALALITKGVIMNNLVDSAHTLLIYACLSMHGANRD